jgi:hypothetical protein
MVQFRVEFLQQLLIVLRIAAGTDAVPTTADL